VRARWPVLGVVVTLALAGGGLVVADRPAARRAVRSFLDRPHADYLLAAGLGVLAVALAAAVLTYRSIRGFDLATPPRVEDVPEGSPPGADLDEVLTGVAGLARAASPSRRRRVRRRLRRAAVRAVRTAEYRSREAARDRVASGAWTVDPAAASFLAGDPDPASLGAGLRLGGPIRFRWHARRAAAAIVDIGGPTGVGAAGNGVDRGTGSSATAPRRGRLGQPTPGGGAGPDDGPPSTGGRDASTAGDGDGGDSA
jgi:hypothetical protein